jgi:hypothetical protein
MYKVLALGFGARILVWSKIVCTSWYGLCILGILGIRTVTFDVYTSG